MRVKYATISQAGARPINEDCLHIMDMPEADRFMGIVCDGMGGHTMGEVASRIVCHAISRYWEEHASQHDCEEKVLRACCTASLDIDRETWEHGHGQMGTTMVMASIEGRGVTIAHVGDSRCYLQRPGDGLLYRTEDHTTLANGREQVSRCFFSYRPEVARPETRMFQLQGGDRILICSDGLYKAVAPSTLQTGMMARRPLQQILDDFGLLCEGQSGDNYTGILVEVE